MSAPYFNFKQVILGLVDLFTNFDFNCDGHYDRLYRRRARGITFCVYFY